MLKQLYHLMPPSMRDTVSTLRGYYLRSWRYGPETEGLIEQTLEREEWSQDRWKRWREERLAYILHRAATSVPFYRNYWQAARRRGDHRSWERLENWPLLRKESVRREPRAFVADDKSPRQLFCEATSGTTGTPLPVFVSKATLREFYAVFEARTRRWHGVSIREPWAMFGGQLVVPFHQRKPPFWVHNRALNQLYLSTHHLSVGTARDYAAALRAYNPTHVVGYPSSLNVLAAAASAANVQLPRCRVVICNAEGVGRDQRESISAAFGAPVRSTYGMAELVAAGSECQEGVMHAWPEVGLIEVFDSDCDAHAAAGSEGRFVATGLLNPDMPLIRYAVGDQGRLTEDSTPCSCGRGLPALATIAGRANDLIVTPDGRKIFWLNPVFYGLAVIEAQIVQATLEIIHIRVVAGLGFREKDKATIAMRVRERVGDVDVHVDTVAHIPRTAAGKLQTVISHVYSA